MTQDPIGLAGEVNLYAYSGNNPVSYRDPFGLCPIPVLCEALDIIAVAADLQDIRKNGLGWSNGLALAADVLAVAVPVLPAGAGVAQRGARVANQADNVADGAKLGEHLRQLEKYGQAGFRELQNGRIRYYGELKKAHAPGEMAGRRLVREWDPATGAARTWHETLDHKGRVRIVRPQAGQDKQHFIFDENGNFTGTR